MTMLYNNSTSLFVRWYVYLSLYLLFLGILFFAPFGFFTTKDAHAYLYAFLCVLTLVHYTYLALSCIPIKHDVILVCFKHTRLKLPLHKTIVCQTFVNGLFFKISNNFRKKNTLTSNAKKNFCLTCFATILYRSPRLSFYIILPLCLSWLYRISTFVTSQIKYKGETIIKPIFLQSTLLRP